ncbi:malonyl-ACP O-methyltransferase BioC [Leeia oryzae]|uniref:malonyl-ACP O-methyltransferase BioC n=1 Tax=Leeia oryzae TaxID=356662 RepID=UPI00037DD3D4|nr:malonyl-ACP O-methyltransferase BioC [Leeia oryzae]
MTEHFLPNKRLMRKAFNEAASRYDAAAILQQEVCNRMAERLEYIKHQPATVLDAGSGTGFGRDKLQTAYPKASVIELDIAHAMLLAARQKTSRWKRLFKDPPAVCGDIEQLPLADNSLDMIWSNLAIQWVNDLDKAFAEFHRVLAPNGLLMFSTLGPDTLKELRQAFAGVDQADHVNRFVDMHDIGDGLVKNGFATPVMDMEYITLTYQDVRTVMQDLKAIGAHNVMHGRPAGLMGKQRWQRVIDNYETLRKDGQLPATYEIVYGHAWKPEPKPVRVLADGRQVIEFRPRNT